MMGTQLQPWELDELSGDWIEALDALVYRLPGMAEGRRKVMEAVAGIKRARKWVQ